MRKDQYWKVEDKSTNDQFDGRITRVSILNGNDEIIAEGINSMYAAQEICNKHNELFMEDKE